MLGEYLLHENRRNDVYVLGYLLLLLLNAGTEVYVYFPSLPTSCAEMVLCFLFEYIMTS